MSDSPNDYPLRVVAKGQSFQKTLRNIDEARLFLEKELDYWRGLSSTWAALQSPVTEFIQAITIQRLQKAQGELQSPAMLPIALRGIVFSEGTYGRTISEMAESQPAAVPGAILAMSAKESPDGFLSLSAPFAGNRLNFATLATVIVALEKIHIGERTTKAEREQLQELIVEAQALRDEITDLKASEKSLLDEQVHSATKLVDDSKSSLAETLVQAELSLSSLLKASETTIRDLEEKTKNRIILEAPTKYWSDKAKGHRNAAIWFGVLFILSLAAGTYWLTHHGVNLVADAHKQIVGDRQEAGLLALVPLAFITLPTLAFAWLLRHVSRIIVQNISLGADARLRGTIATTYSALTHDRPSNPAELAIALQALFRPIDGSAHSEIAPPNIQEIMEMATGKGRG